jgi:hypothetical protein
MSEIKRSMVCVGGPFSGRRVASKYPSGFLAPVRQPDGPEGDPAHELYQPNRPVKATNTRYREEVFHTPQGAIALWTPADQTPFETMSILLEEYSSKPTLRRWREVFDRSDDRALIGLVMTLTGGQANPALVQAQIDRLRAEAAALNAPAATAPSIAKA